MPRNVQWFSVSLWSFAFIAISRAMYYLPAWSDFHLTSTAQAPHLGSLLPCFPLPIPKPPLMFLLPRKLVFFPSLLSLNFFLSIILGGIRSSGRESSSFGECRKTKLWWAAWSDRKGQKSLMSASALETDRTGNGERSESKGRPSNRGTLAEQDGSRSTWNYFLCCKENYLFHSSRPSLWSVLYTQASCKCFLIETKEMRFFHT